MKRVVFILITFTILFLNSNLYSQTPGSIDNFMPSMYRDLGPLSDESNPLMQELRREQYHQFGDFFLSKRNEYLRKISNSKLNRMNQLGATDYPYFGGIQYFGIIGGFGVNTLFSKKINKDWRINFHLGLLSLSNSYLYNRYLASINPNLNGLNSSILILPTYIGAQRFILSKHLSDRVKLYLEAGLGPTIGMNIPYGYGFFNSFANSQYRLTPGVFAGSGANVEIHKNYSAFMDIKYHVIVFNGNLGYTNNFSTPSIFFGVSRGFSSF